MNFRIRSHRIAVAACAWVSVAFLGAACASSGRTPATAELPLPVEDSGVAGEPAAPPEPPGTADRSSGGLTEDEILARAPESSITSEALDVASMSLAELNATGPLEDIRFEYDSADLSEAAQTILARNAEWLRRHPTVEVQIEGHCDERGTVEYNLALGEARARSVRDFLTRLDVAAARLRIISFGKEVPLDPGHDEAAWGRNRRAHFVVVAR